MIFKKHTIEVLISFFVFLVIGCFVVKEAETSEKAIYKRIKCKDDKHSYVAYLPPNYTESKKWPVLFCFDPSACGDWAAKVFSSAAVDYGWIVVGSLDAKNGPWEPIERAQSAMLNDVKKRYNIDEKRLYAAGFSGGARMAYTMAYKYPNKFRGVIACSAGFGKGKPSKKVAVFHCVGKHEVNYSEVKKAHNYLISQGCKSKLRVFEGGHDWPPEEVILEGLEWISKN